ncbi:MAG: hypothetical protein ABIY70_00090 [Capsulimonas sp.]|uniref:hypothetical protein n=1 Tax=Capsulimonas sp. TaxID=2494211 RepID=UPI003264CFAE
MPISYFPQPDHSWETLDGEAPEALLDRHPTGEFLAMQTDTGGKNRAAIWNAHTKKIVWNPGDISALSWLPDGMEILAVREEYHPDPRLHNAGGVQIVSPLQREFSYFVERLSWPAAERTASAPLTLPTGWVSHVVVSPTAPLGFIVWHEQNEGGVEQVTWQDGNLRQVPNAGYGLGGVIGKGPLFSPDGRYLALSSAEPFWWFDGEDSEADPYDDEGAPSPGGEFQFGSIVIGNVMTGSYHSVGLTMSVPEGWTPDDPDEASYEAVTSIAFADDGSIHVSLWNGEERTISVSP